MPLIVILVHVMMLVLMIVNWPKISSGLRNPLLCHIGFTACVWKSPKKEKSYSIALSEITYYFSIFLFWYNTLRFGIKYLQLKLA